EDPGSGGELPGQRDLRRGCGDRGTIVSIAAASPRGMRGVSDRSVWRENRLALLEMRGETFLDLRSGEAEKLERQRCVECRPHGTQPVVQCVFGPADGALRALGQPGRNF